MPITPERIARLRQFGLSEYAARSYLALLDLGTTEARDVSALSKVPGSKIYHILDQLHEKGLVVISPEFPRKYSPVPFGDFLQRIHDEHETLAATIRGERETLESMFAVVGGLAGGDRGSVTLLRGRRNVLERASEMLATAEHDCLLLVSASHATDLRAWAEPVHEARGRGLRVRVLCMAEGAYARPRGRTLPAEAYAVVADGRRALLAHALPDDGHPTDGNDVALFVDQEGIVALLSAVLDAQWKAAAGAVQVPLRETPALERTPPL